MPSTACPSRDELSGYILGKLLTERSEEIDMHLQRCGECQASLETISAHSDTLLSGLHRREPGPYVDEPQCQRALARVQAIGAEPSLTAREQLAAAEAGPYPRQIGPYRLLAELGRGGMGTVYKALHTKLDRVVALKVLPQDRMQAADAVARFEREMKAVGKLDHPNIVRASDADEENGLHYLVMEYVDGIDLAELARRAGPLTIADACELVRQAAMGLQHAHEHGLVHRDIKPSNLMLCQVRSAECGMRSSNLLAQPSSHSALRTPHSALVKILDLGLALLADSGDQRELTSSGQTMGTLDYMAPEQCGDSHAVDIRADIYSLGATLYKLLTGEPIFAGANYHKPIQRFRALAMESAPPIQSRRAEIPDALAAVVARMVARDPQDRYATPFEVAMGLTPFCEGADLAALVADTADAQHAAEAPTAATLPNLSQPEVDTDRSSSPPSREAPAPPKRPARTAAMLALGGIAAALAALVIYLESRYGTVQITIHDPDIKVAIDNRGTIIQGADKHDIRVKPGEHRLTITHGDLTFDTDRFTLSRGDTTRLEVKLLAGEVQVLNGGDVIGRKPLPPGDTAPQVAGVTTADYDNLATGRWVRVLASQEEFNRLWAAGALRQESPLAGPPPSLIDYDDGVLHLAGIRSIFDASLNGKDMIVRARVKKILKTGNAGLRIRNKTTDDGPGFPGGYQLQLMRNGGIELGKATGARFTRLGLHQAEVSEDYVELALAAVGDRITGYLNGKKIVEVQDSSCVEGSAGLYVFQSGALFKDIEVMLLDSSDRRAAEWVLSIGGVIRINGQQEWIGNLSELPSEPLVLSGVSLPNNQQATDENLARLERCNGLTFLDLSNTPVTDAGLEHFQDCAGLQFLWLGGCEGVTHQGLGHFRNCKELRELTLPATKVTDQGLAHFKDCRNLYKLSVSRCPGVTDGGLAHFQGSKSLAIVLIDGTAVTDEGLAHLAECSGLRTLWSFDCEGVTDAGLIHLRGCRFLQDLRISKTGVTEAGVTALRQNLPQCKITWDGGVIEPKWTKAVPAPSAALVALRREQIPPAALAFAGDGDPRRAPPSLVAVLGTPGPVHTANIYNMAYRPDGRWLATAAGGGSFLLREADSGAVRRELHGHWCAGFSPDSKTLISVDPQGWKTKPKLWPTENDAAPTTLALEGQADKAVLSPDGRFLAALTASGVQLYAWGAWDKPIALRAVRQGKPVGPATTHVVPVFSPDGNTLACGGRLQNADSTWPCSRSIAAEIRRG